MAVEIERTGVVRGKRVIELDDDIPLLDGSPVRLRLVPQNGQDATDEAVAEETLNAIHQMRHQGRSIQKP